MLVLIIIVAIFAGCEPRTDGPDEGDSRPSIVEDSDGNILTVGDITIDWSYDIAHKYELNYHTVGWIDVPGTNISGVVLRNPECRDNYYYLRRGFDREFYFNGVYYIDIRAGLGPTREYLGINTTIYGHALTDDPEDEDFNIKFGQLHRFRDEEFAREHRYIFFSLPEENLVFEIIAVFYGNSHNPAFFYNDNPGGWLSSRNDPNDFITVIEDMVIPRSLWIYDVEFDVNDRFLTLSTCIYNPAAM